MELATTIQRHADMPDTRHAWITDGRFTCSYQELPDLLAAIDRQLRSLVDPRACLALECSNTLPAALTLICLLQGDYRWMLLPPGGAHEKGSELKPLPAMCQYRLRLNLAAIAAAGEGWPHASVFDLEANAGCQRAGGEGGQPQGQLYIRTSGSMGAAKIVAYSHDKLLNNARNCVERFQLAVGDRVALAVPIFHMYGLGAGFLPALLAGAAIDLQENSQVLRYLDRERTFAPSAAFLTPALCAMIVERRRSPRPYRMAVSAGARLAAEIIHTFAQQSGPLLNLYGSTELGAIAAPAPTDPLDLRAATIGRPMAGVSLVPAAQLQAESRVGPPPAEALSDELFCRHPWGFDA
ncbi:MAG: long-chain fatty acid--CoA ligase, partial [Oscillochloris sp.]|nr:long-chain fatty acid--CoA ligase [Oscillochloris sp.]